MIRMFRYLIAVVLLSATAISPAMSQEVILPTEHSQVIRLPSEASAVIVGNPSIADAMVHDGRTLILTGRLQGRTNVIVLDRVGRVIYSTEIAVTNPIAGQVALFRGTSQHTYSCAGVCDEVPRVGGDTIRTDDLTRAQTTRLGVADNAIGDN